MEVPDGELEVTVTEDGLKLVFGGQAFADAEDVAFRVAEVHLANVPRHICWWERNLQPCGNAVPMHLVDIVDPHRHPHALVACFVVVHLECGRIGTPAAASLRALAEKNAGFST